MGEPSNAHSVELDVLQSTVTPDVTTRDDSSPVQYPRGAQFFLITVGLLLSIFLAAVDLSILSTAIPSITTQFGGISNIAWYGTSYAITNTAFQSSWGKAYDYFPLKTTFMLSILVFEIGNVICALSPSSEVLIIGRIVAGMGGGGIMTGAFIIIALTAGPKYRAAYMGIVGVTFGCASVVGPLLGGALTDGPGWRWCFWISLPIGFAAAMTMFVCFKSPSVPKEARPHEKLIHLDLTGAVLVAGSLSCFVLATHWLAMYQSNSVRVIGSFFGFASLFVCFLLNEWMMGNKAMVQSRLFQKKSVLVNLFYVFFLSGAYFPLLYILPIQFQSVNETTASQSGVRLIPLILGISAFTMITNGLLTFWRHYKPYLFLGAIFAVAGNTRIFMSDANTATREWIVYELLSAIGIGIALQIPMISNQALVPASDMAAATSATLFFENVGTVLFVASGEAAFTKGLVSSLAKNLPSINPDEVLHAGATQIRSSFSDGELEGVLKSYLHGCKTSHIITVACGVAAGLVSSTNAVPAAIRWIKLQAKKPHER